MKKFFYLLLALLPLSFVACNNASNNKSKDKDEPQAASLVGEWKCDKMIEIEDDNDVEYIDLTLSIRSDNTYSMSGDFNQSGTWAQDGDMFYCYVNGSSSQKQEYKIKNLTAKELVLLSYYDEGGERFEGEEFYFSRKSESK